MDRFYSSLCTDEISLDMRVSNVCLVFKQLNLGNQEEAPIIASNWFISRKLKIQLLY